MSNEQLPAPLAIVQREKARAVKDVDVKPSSELVDQDRAQALTPRNNSACKAQVKPGRTNGNDGETQKKWWRAGCATEKKERTEQLSPGKPATGEMPDLRKCQEEGRQA